MLDHVSGAYWSVTSTTFVVEIVGAVLHGTHLSIPLSHLCVRCNGPAHTGCIGDFALLVSFTVTSS